MTSREKLMEAADILRRRIMGYSEEHYRDEALFTSLQNAFSELEQANSSFNELSDVSAVDYASYSLLAAQAKYSYLLKLAKEKDIRL